MSSFLGVIVGEFGCWVILVFVLLLVGGEFGYCGWCNMVDVLGTVSECCAWGVCG